VIQCHHEVLALYFYYYVSIIFSAFLIIQKQQKHANNKKQKKYFHKQSLILNQVIAFLFYFLKSNINQFKCYHEFTFFNIKKHKQILICHLTFYFKTFFFKN